MSLRGRLAKLSRFVDGGVQTAIDTRRELLARLELEAPSLEVPGPDLPQRARALLDLAEQARAANEIVQRYVQPRQRRDVGGWRRADRRPPESVLLTELRREHAWLTELIDRCNAVDVVEQLPDPS
jgi:hypothetical protein